ncbi:aromatic ring-hydroxylating dioxygenase subunit alpha [Marinobacter algicola]|uniref:aromatic ring-hydroxylating dioxygenase subunit alpha n=1 Tax=Marinobacter algicola TaxID=236100 RepID=UPI003BAAC870
MTVTSNSAKAEVQDAEESGHRVPYKVFTERKYFDLEQERLFRGKTWSFVALEAEIPNSGDYKSTLMGQIPVIVTRAEDGSVHVMQNRCAHRGAQICRSLRGNTPTLECVYHQWAYDLTGNLIGLPFRRGIKGKGGMPKSFDMSKHGLNQLRVETLNGVIFATFSGEVEPLQEYLGPKTVEHLGRIFNRPIKVLGDQRQYIRGNWKLYAENTRDPYHASLLHLFHATFGLYRSSQTGASIMDGKLRHSMLYSQSSSNDEARDKEVFKDARSFDSDFQLNDPSVLAGRKEFDDPITLIIMALFPNVIVQQIANTLAVRQIVTYAEDEFELVWTQFGYADDDEDMQTIRRKQSNLIGPAGFISMEDGEAVELVHGAVVRDQEQTSYIAMGGDQAADADHLVTEGAIIGFWDAYREVMELDAKYGIPE